MKVINMEKDFEIIEGNVDILIDKSKSFPENVFRGVMRYFLFITFDELTMPIFFNHLKIYLASTDETSFWVVAIDPNPRSYFASNYQFYGAFEFQITDDRDDYISALADYPQENPADALMHNSNILVVLSSSKKWAIFGSREADIAVCAFTDRVYMDLFKLAYGSDLLGGEKAAGEYAYGTFGKDQRVELFCKSYFNNQ